jgi:hypothetical protein
VIHSLPAGLASIALVLALAGHAPGTSPSATEFDRGSWAPPGEGLTLVREHRYRMIGRVRPLLFWIASDNVGAGDIRWKSGEGSVIAYELVIGSDPARAPGGLNRWGYIAEEVRGAECRVLGVISTADESSLGDVRTDLRSRAPRQYFETIRATVTPNQSRAMISTIGTPADLTYHDVQALLDRVMSGSDPAKLRETPRPPDARPGFLTSVAELMGPTGRPGSRVPYVYGGRIYDLRLTSKVTLGTLRLGNRAYARVTQSAFEIRDRITSGVWRFELTYSTDGDLAGVPIVIQYRPRWWLEVELRLEG